MRAIAFAYHNVGVRCLSVLLAHGIEIPLVITHRDAAGESIWFDSVAALCDRAAIPWITPFSGTEPGLAERLAGLAPDFIFSFYYRHMLPAAILDIPRGGAFNMHGSLLPRYRGRAPVNWAVLHGERETGATLHEMSIKPDAGALVGQQAVPILPNDTAFEVFQKVTVAAELLLDRTVGAFIGGRVPKVPQDLSAGSYFGGRTPEDGRIDWSKDAWSVHNLVRAVAPPYPGAFTFVGGRRLRILRSWWEGQETASFSGAPTAPALMLHQGALWIACTGGGLIRLVEGEIDGLPINPDNFVAQFGSRAVALER